MPYYMSVSKLVELAGELSTTIPGASPETTYLLYRNLWHFTREDCYMSDRLCGGASADELNGLVAGDGIRLGRSGSMVPNQRRMHSYAEATAC